MKKYKLTDETINVRGKTLYRIEALRDLANIKKGEKGGFIEKEENLSHEGDCFVYNYACVFNDATVRDGAIVAGCAVVEGRAKLSKNAVVDGFSDVDGDAEVTSVKDCANVIIRDKHCITLTKNHIKIGCMQHTIAYWSKNIRKIVEENGYSKQEIKAVILILRGLLLIRK